MTMTMMIWQRYDDADDNDNHDNDADAATDDDNYDDNRPGVEERHVVLITSSSMYHQL